MADKQFDISTADQRLYHEKQKERMALRAHYLKNITNPYRHATGEGGHMFDPAIFRQIAMRAKEYDHFRPTPKNGFVAFSLVAAPCLIYGWLIMRDRNAKEASYRNGEVAYRDRRFKLI